MTEAYRNINLGKMTVEKNRSDEVTGDEVTM
jgi:hypothetical protein